MGKKNKALFSELESAKNVYNERFETYQSWISKVNDHRSISVNTIEMVEGFTTSLRNQPMKIKHQLNTIEKNKKTFIDVKDIQQEEHNKDNMAKMAAVGAIGGGGILAYSFKDFISNLTPKKSKDERGTYILVWLVILVFIVFVLIGYLVWSFFNRRKTSKKLKKNIKEIQLEISNLNNTIQKAQNHLSELIKQDNLVNAMLREVSGFEGKRFNKLNSDDQERIFSMINQTIHLSEAIIADVG